MLTITDRYTTLIITAKLEYIAKNLTEIQKVPVTALYIFFSYMEKQHDKNIVTMIKNELHMVQMKQIYLYLYQLAARGVAGNWGQV